LSDRVKATKIATSFSVFRSRLCDPKLNVKNN